MVTGVVVTGVVVTGVGVTGGGVTGGGVAVGSSTAWACADNDTKVSAVMVSAVMVATTGAHGRRGRTMFVAFIESVRSVSWRNVIQWAVKGSDMVCIGTFDG